MSLFYLSPFVVAEHNPKLLTTTENLVLVHLWSYNVIVGTPGISASMKLLLLSFVGKVNNILQLFV